MNKIVLILLLVTTSLFFGGCYNDFETPGPNKVWTDADFEPDQLISIAELKQIFNEAYPGGGIGESLTITEDLVIRGKVISSDEAGNVYKSMYLYDEESQSAIEVKLYQDYYMSYPAGKIVYVRLKDLTLGNYRTMISIGVASRNSSYANGNIEDQYLVDQHIKSGEYVGMTSADTLVVNASNYASLTDASLGRLVRFEGVRSEWGTAGWGYRNTFPNYFANSTSFDVNSTGWANVEQTQTWAEFIENATWAHKAGTTYYYGSAWFTYGDVNTLPGNYVVRSSGYSDFRDEMIPKNGETVDITAIYTKFAPDTGDSRAAYQLLLNRASDVVKK